MDLLQLRGERETQRLAYSFQADHRDIDTLTYGVLDQRARAVAARLQTIGAPGDRVLLLYQSGLDYIVALFGCLYAGRVAVPVLPPRANRPAPGLTEILHDASPRVALASAASVASLQARFDGIVPAGTIPCLSVDSVPDSWATEWEPPACRPESLAVLQYTSGSTSEPKGVMITHANMMCNLAIIQRNFANTPEDVGVFWLPPYHDMGLVGTILQPLYVGAPSHLIAAASFLQRPGRWLQLMSHYGATVTGAPNFGYELAAQRMPVEQREQLDLRPWRLAFCGGEPIRWQTLQRFTETFEPSGFRRDAFHPCYGLAESTLIVSGDIAPSPIVVAAVDPQALATNRVDPAQESRAPRLLVGCGSAAPEHSIAIVNPETREGCADAEVGEIWVSGPSVAAGYWNRPEETETIFAARRADTGTGPFMRTGDLGFLQDGRLFVTGRIKDLIIIRGRNHYAADLELSVASSHDALLPASGAAFSVEVDGEECLVIVHEIDRRWPHDALGEVVTAIQRALSDHHELQPYAVVLTRIGSVPKTSSGKIKRLTCRADYLGGTLDVIHEVRAHTPMPADAFADLPDVLRECEHLGADRQHERLLAFFRIAAGRIPALKGAELSRLDQPLTELGLDSLTMVEFSQALSHTLGRPLPSTLLFEYPTLDALARYLLNGDGQLAVPTGADVTHREEREEVARRTATASDAEVEAMLVEKLRKIGALSNQQGD